MKSAFGALFFSGAEDRLHKGRSSRPYRQRKNNIESEQIPWSQKNQGDISWICWVRQSRGVWARLGESEDYDEAWGLFTSQSDLRLNQCLITTPADGNPNQHKANGGQGAPGLRRELDHSRVPLSPMTAEEREAKVAYYEELAKEELPLFELYE